jgi:hypothetical protein
MSHCLSRYLHTSSDPRRRTIQRVLLWVVTGISAASFAETRLPVPAKSSDPLADFIHHANPYGEQRFLAEIDTSGARYFLYQIKQQERSGLALIRMTEKDQIKIVAADTAIDTINSFEPKAVKKTLVRAIAKLAIPNPIGTSMDQFLVPITGLRLGSNSTWEILKTLQRTDTVQLDPNHALPGTVFVVPTRFQSVGPIKLGISGILGSDRFIYGSNANHPGQWIRLDTVHGWIEKYQNDLYAFLIRKRSNLAPGLIHNVVFER